MAEITAQDDRIDSRDVIDRFNELSYADDNDFIDADEKAELQSLAKLMLIGMDFNEWDSGMVLVNEGHFTEYAKEFRQECNHELFESMPDWVKDNLDWDEIAEDMLSDFTVIEWEGKIFYTM
jgi:hypothetical protein